MKLPPCAELQDRSAFSPAHLSLPTHQLQTYCVALTYLHLVSGDNLKVPSPAGLAHTGFAFDTLSKCNPAHGARVMCWQQPQPRLNRVGGQQCTLWGAGRWESKPTAHWVSHRGGVGALTSPKCLNLLGRKKQKKSNNVIQCLQKRNHYFPTAFRGSCWGEGEEQKK